MSYLIKERMMRDKANRDDSVTLGDSAVGVMDKNVSAKKEGGTEGPLFEAKKEKVEVAGYNHLSAVVKNEKSSLNIDRLPNEMLEKIFEILIELENDNGSHRRSKRITNIESYLNCRLVSTRWKFWMESVLEKMSISIWKAKSVPISIKNMEAEPPALKHLYVHETEDEFTPVKWTFLPPALESWDGKGSPFPSRSLKLTSHLENCDDLLPSPRPRRAQLVRLTDFFSKFGEHLTSLILTSVTLSPETFIGILGNTPKLKVLNLNMVVFRGDLANFAQLPALEHLHHLRVFYVKIMLKTADARDIDFPYNNDKKIKLYNWIYSPFIQQLLTLDIDGKSGIGTVANFANLERLFISCIYNYDVADPSFLQPQLFLYPRLKSLFLRDVDIRWNRDIIEWFQQHITPFAETLVELHLAIPYGYSGGLNRVGPLFQHPPQSIQKKTNEVVFQKLKTLEITFPKYPEEVEVIKALIKMFPKLEALTFLERNYGVDAEDVVDREEYKKACPTLKKIRIRDWDL
ncbi:unnamed protein product [Orchesella dallaii]|uniref:F-box domain-containing protein n=1 Tax=Orchesella dallaii TaxID=48710 RepID=A0ABP1QEV7_9HEXA